MSMWESMCLAFRQIGEDDIQAEYALTQPGTLFLNKVSSSRATSMANAYGTTPFANFAKDIPFQALLHPPDFRINPLKNAEFDQQPAEDDRLSTWDIR